MARTIKLLRLRAAREVRESRQFAFHAKWQYRVTSRCARSADKLILRRTIKSLTLHGRKTTKICNFVPLCTGKVTLVCYFAHRAKLQQCAFSRTAQSYSNLLSDAMLEKRLSVPYLCKSTLFCNFVSSENYIFCLIFRTHEVTYLCYFAPCGK